MPEEGRADAGRLLRRWRERALLTQGQLAARAQLNVRTVRRLETAPTVRPHSTTLRLLVAALGLSATEAEQLRTAARAAPVEDHRGDRSPRELPADTGVFTGRGRELAVLQALHEEFRAEPVLVVVDGMAGVGKTALAVRAAHLVAARYPDGQIVVDLHGYTDGVEPTDPHDALGRILRSLGTPADQLPHDLDGRVATYRTRTADRRLLLLLDNVASERQLGPLLPGGPGNLVLVTSRRRLPAVGATRTVSLDALPAADALALFGAVVAGRAAGPGDEAASAAVVEHCGRLPLAIRIAGARLLARPSWTVAHLARRLGDQRDQLTEFVAGDRSVRAALALSNRTLPPEHQRIYRLSGLHPGVEFDADAVAALAGCGPGRATAALDALLESHLVVEPTPGRFGFHDLVRTHVREVVEEVETAVARVAARRRLVGHYVGASSAAVDLAYPFERSRRPACAASDPSATGTADPAAARAWLERETPTLLALAADDPGFAAHLSGTLDWHLRSFCRFDESQRLHAGVVAAAQASGDRATEAAALVRLGRVHRHLGQVDRAVAALEAGLRGAREQADGQSEVDALAALGVVFNSVGRYRQAADRCAAALAVARSHGDEDGALHALMGLGWSNIGLGRPAIGEFGAALPSARRSGHRVIELHALRGLGHEYRSNGDLDRAAAAYEMVLGIAREIQNPYGELGALVANGHIAHAQGRSAAALAYFEQVREVAERVGSRNFRFEALQGTGRVLSSRGCFERALDLHHAALQVAADLGQLADRVRAHDGTAHALAGLGRHCDAAGHWRDALELLATLDSDATEEDGVTAAAMTAHLGRSVARS